MAVMLEMQFTFHACDDLSAIWDSIAVHPGLWRGPDPSQQATAEAFSRDFKHHAELLAVNPEMGRERNELLFGLRSSAFGKYTIFYRVRGGCMEVLRVLASSPGTHL